MSTVNDEFRSKYNKLDKTIKIILKLSDGESGIYRYLQILPPDRYIELDYIRQFKNIIVSHNPMDGEEPQATRKMIEVLDKELNFINDNLENVTELLKSNNDGKINTKNHSKETNYIKKQYEVKVGKNLFIIECKQKGQQNIFKIFVPGTQSFEFAARYNITLKNGDIYKRCTLLPGSVLSDKNKIRKGVQFYFNKYEDILIKISIINNKSNHTGHIKISYNLDKIF